MTKTKIIVTVCIVLILGVGLFFYLTRPAATPTTDIQTAATGDQLQTTPTQTQTGATAIYRISQTDSTARFSVGEVLRGNPFTAVGVTHQIAGDIELNTANPSLSKLGVMKVNARTLKTDSTQRDGAISRFILKSDEDANEFIQFSTTALSGMPEKIEVGVPASFTAVGSLTIKGITKPATFTGNFTLEADGRVTGSAESVAKRSDFNLVIPNVPFVASVEENVNLKVTISASKV